jgi:hypothetical protein
MKTGDYIGFAVIAFLILLGGLTICAVINDPIDNVIEGVHCKIESYSPSHEGTVKIGTYIGKTELPEKVVIRLDDGTVAEPTLGAIGTCRVGQDAEAAIRVGQITGKLIKAVFVACYER